MHLGCLTPIRSLSLTLGSLPLSRRALLLLSLLRLNRQIRRACRRILAELRVMRALVDRFERTLDPSARRRLLALPPTSGTFALARLRWCTEDIHILLMELTRRASEFPRDTGHH